MSKLQEDLYELILLDSKKEEVWLGDNENKNRLRIQAKRWNLGDAIVLVVSEKMGRLDAEVLRQQLWAQAKSQGKDGPLLIVSPMEFKFLRIVKVDEKDKPEDNKVQENPT